MKSIKVILFILLYCCNFCLAQTNYLPGYYINTDGETIRGFINYQEWVVNPDKVRFKKDKKEKALIITPKTAKGFGVDNKDKYVTRIVDINIAPIKLNELGTTREPVYEQETVFLQVLVDGTATLYFLNDVMGKKHFFIEKADIPVEELIYTKYLKKVDGEQVPMPFEQYKGQLTNAFSDCGEAYRLIKKAKYEIGDIKRIFEKYNGCNDGNTSTYVYQVQKPSFQFGGIVGGGISVLDFGGESSLDLHDMDFPITPAYSVGLFFRMNAARWRGRFAMQSELTYTAFTANSTYETSLPNELVRYSDVNFNWGYFQLNTLLQYTFPLNNKIKPYFNGGTGWAFLVTDNNSIYTKTTFFSTTRTETKKVFDTKFTEIALIGGFGVTSKKFSLGLRVDGGRRISPFDSFFAKQKMVLITGQYHF